MKKVTQFPGTFRPPEPPKIVYSTVSHGGSCDHYPIDYEVDESAGTVMCVECKTTLDPLWVLKQLYYLAEDERKRIEKRKRK